MARLGTTGSVQHYPGLSVNSARRAYAQLGSLPADLNGNIKSTAKRARSEQQPACISGADADTGGRSTQPEATATVEPAAKRRRRCEPTETDKDERGQLDFIRSLVPGVSIVWAKYSKYPFWPGKVIAADVMNVRVVFFGDQTEERISNMAFVQPFPGSAAMHERFKQQALGAATDPEAFLAGFAQATADHEEFQLQHQTEQVGFGCRVCLVTCFHCRMRLCFK